MKSGASIRKNQTGTGTLFIVSTPIGNLEDVTFRAKRILEEVSFIAAEDTRRTRKLLSHFGIDTSLTSFHDFNKEEKGPAIVQSLSEGLDVALVSDSGTPGISDPAYRLVRLAVSQRVEVVPIPGPCAALAALVVSGLPTDRFVFEGFLPRKAAKRKQRLKELKCEKRTMIFYETPHRLQVMLQDAYEIFGGREVSISRELTKRFEETLRSQLGQFVGVFEEKVPKGEFVVVVKGGEKE